MLGLPFEATQSDIVEDLSSPLSSRPGALAISLAVQKARAARQAGHAGILLSFDTLVVHAGSIFGKPEDLEDARRMLRSLAGSSHEVVTGCAVLPAEEDEPEVFAVSTPVRMRKLSEADIAAWVAKEELMGCAGAYNIENHLADVDDDQCFQNVAGLPLCHLYVTLRRMRKRLDLDRPKAPVAQCDLARGRHCLLGPRLVKAVDS